MGVLRKTFCSFVLLECLLIGKVLSTDDLIVPAEPLNNEGKDRFRDIISNVSSSETEKEVSNFLNYSCEVMVVIKNEAEGPVRLRCASKTNKAKESRLSPGHSLIFTIKPHTDGTSDFWCSLSYVHLWARFDTYTEDNPDFCPRNKVYRYSVRHDGLYAKPDKDGGHKIRALFKGHNEYRLWESYDEKEGADGLLLHGYVDGGMCSDLPDHLDDRTAVVTVCNHDCVLAYDLRRCKGDYEKLQAGDGCQDFRMDSTLHHKISAIKGC